MELCKETSFIDFGSPCVRSIWATLAPTTLSALYLVTKLLFRLPHPSFVKQVASAIAWPFTPFISLEEAVAGSNPTGEEGVSEQNTEEKTAFKHALYITVVSLLEVGVWVAAGVVGLIRGSGSDGWERWRCFVITIPWLYSAVRPFAKPMATPPFDLFWLYSVQLISSVLFLGGVLFDNYVASTPLPDNFTMAGYILNAVAIPSLLGVVTSLPLALPPKSVDKEKIGEEISPEDYTPLWKWITFEWVWPLVNKGTYATLNEIDVWKLSPRVQSRPVFTKFSQLKQSTLVRRLWAANVLDFTLDFLLMLVSVTFNFSSPYFLKGILDVLDLPDPSRREISIAYMYATFMFLVAVLRAQSDVQHLWFGRRAGTRVRSELMASIYEKSLKRLDFSGIVEDKVNEKDGEKTGKEKEKEGKDQDNKSGADVGKIVQLMSGDANRISMLITGMYFIYGAPFEIIFAMTFLYNLLGVSAFAGVLVLIFAAPLNSYLANRSMRIQKGLLAARDKRMSVLNEVIASIKFIKFFAWESKWIGRANEARKNEIKWLVKARLNNILFGLLWMSAPILVSISAFTSFVLLGNELTISVAFTSIALFTMLRAPLNVIPSWIVIILQTKVSLDRLDAFLGEPEVDSQVSSLKRDVSAPSSQSFGQGVSPLGIEKGSFRWNVAEKKDAVPKKKWWKWGSGKVAGKDSREGSITNTEREGVRFELQDITVTFPQGQLTVVTGPTASGKTALIMALLGEMTKIPGTESRLLLDKDPLKISSHGLGQYISYAAQSPWLQHATIKDNVLFGEEMDSERYEQVLEACALKPDLAIFEDGDMTEIGARGVSLSGGQKARVALARAIYAKSQYVLLDDPLSAVDSHTARFLYENVLKGPLLANRTVVLITHHVELVLPGTYYLVRMLDGRIDQQGLVTELRANGALDYIMHDATMEVKREEKLESLQEPTADGAQLPDKAASNAPRKLVKEELRQEGAVKWDVYNTYLKASSYWTWAVLLFFIVITQILGIGEKLWIKTWGEAYKNEESFLPTGFIASGGVPHSEMNPVFQHTLVPPVQMPHLLPQNYSTTSITAFWSQPSPYEHPMYFVGIYSAIGLATVLIQIMSSAVQLTGALRASRLLFGRLLDTVAYATIRFHDTTPAGRLLNRFSKDIETIDQSLASSLQQVNVSLAAFFASALAVAVIFPGFLIPAFIIGYVYRKLGIAYLNTGRDLRRMESNSRSPIFSGFAELLDGIITVRAFSSERRFLNNLFAKIDLTTQMWYTFWMTNRWLLLHYDFLGALAVLVTNLLALGGRVPAGFAGLTITSAMSFTMSIYWTCRFWTELELNLNSVERVVEYLELPQEPPAIIESKRPPAYWPSSSQDRDMLVVEKLVIRYSPELPAVLHGVSFALRGRERVGLLGRTGSGKSTLAMSILRFVDPTEGTILIDGIDITQIGLHDLRSRMTFIPQDATLFTGTIRDNLDPFNEYTDADCLDVLFRVQMLSQSAHTSQKTSRAPSIHEVEATESAQHVPSPSGSETLVTADDEEKVTVTLDTKVSAGGANFSQGQRQLLALARALLRNSSLVIMDEATSSIDFATDAKIQATIRDEFKNALLLTVAHRLRTIIDYDRLIVLDHGKVAELDTPYNLICKEGGIFRDMCINSGTFKELEEIAKTQSQSR